MIRRWFRLGLTLGVLSAIGFAVVKVLRNRATDDAAVAAAVSNASREPWTPLTEVPTRAATPAAPAPPAAPPTAAKPAPAAAKAAPAPAPEPAPKPAAAPKPAPAAQAAPPAPAAAPKPAPAAKAPAAKAPVAKAAPKPAPTPAPAPAPAPEIRAERAERVERADEVDDERTAPEPVSAVRWWEDPSTTAVRRDEPVEPAHMRKAAAARPAKRAAKAAEKAAKKAPLTAKKAGAKKAAKKRAAVAAWVDPNDGVCPTSHPVKAKLTSKIFHIRGGMNYERAVPERCYRDPAAAEADGLRQSKM